MSGTWLHDWRRYIPDWMCLEIIPELSATGSFSPGTIRLSFNMQCALSYILSFHPVPTYELDVEPSFFQAQIGLGNSLQAVRQGPKAKGRSRRVYWLQPSLGSVYLGLLGDMPSSVPRAMSFESSKVTVGLDRLPRYVVPGLAIRCNGYINTKLSQVTEFLIL